MSKKITIETIQGKPYTVVWYKDVETSSALLGRRLVELSNGCLGVFHDANCLNLLATALPALPRKPKPEDARLIYRYMAEGLHPWGTGRDGAIYPNGLGPEGLISLSKRNTKAAEITHAICSETGERVEIATADEEKDNG